jgi:hypothetical protein
MILALKLFLTPLFIALASLAGRRWGPAVSGWLIGFPLTSAPVSLILAIQNGTTFAAHSAIGNLGGQASVCVFCLGYSLAARKTGWLPSAAAALGAFFISTLLWNSFTLSLWPTFIILMLMIALAFYSIPAGAASPAVSTAPRWDLPARMALAAAFVFILTTFAEAWGPQLSGLITPFPIFGVILTTFTHRQQGAQAAFNLLRAYIAGSVGYGFFFLIVGGLLPFAGILWTYLLATAAVLSINSFYLLFSRHKQAGD